MFETAKINTKSDLEYFSKGNKKNTVHLML